MKIQLSPAGKHLEHDGRGPPKPIGSSDTTHRSIGSRKSIDLRSSAGQGCVSPERYANELRMLLERPHASPTAGSRLILFGLTSALVLWLSGCAGVPPVTEGYPSQSAMPGKTKAQLLACAGPPTRQGSDGALTLLRYYREAPMLEESVVGSKSSHAGLHHGCWATVVLRGDRIEAVHYRFVPDSVDASDDCEEIFADCQ